MGGGGAFFFKQRSFTIIIINEHVTSAPGSRFVLSLVSELEMPSRGIFAWPCATPRTSKHTFSGTMDQGHGMYAGNPRPQVSSFSARGVGR